MIRMYLCVVIDQVVIDMFTIIILIEREEVCYVDGLNILLMISRKVPHFGALRGSVFFLLQDRFFPQGRSLWCYWQPRFCVVPTNDEGSSVKPAVAACSMLRLFSCLGFEAESLHGKHFY